MVSAGRDVMYRFEISYCLSSYSILLWYKDFQKVRSGLACNCDIRNEVVLNEITSLCSVHIELFLLGLFNDTVSSRDHITSNENV